MQFDRPARRRLVVRAPSESGDHVTYSAEAISYVLDVQRVTRLAVPAAEKGITSAVWTLYAHNEAVNIQDDAVVTLETLIVCIL